MVQDWLFGALDQPYPATTIAGLRIRLFAQIYSNQAKASPSSVSAFVLTGAPIQEDESC
jgi:hypothetical protein